MPNFLFGKLSKLSNNVNALMDNQPSAIMESKYQSDNITDMSSIKTAEEYNAEPNRIFIFGIHKWGDKRQVVGH
jgi:hypothetical protein